LDHFAASGLLLSLAWMNLKLFCMKVLLEEPVCPA